MTLLGQLQEQHNHFIESVQKMRANGNPLVLFGPAAWDK